MTIIMYYFNVTCVQDKHLWIMYYCVCAKKNKTFIKNNLLFLLSSSYHKLTTNNPKLQYIINNLITQLTCKKDDVII